MLLVSHEGPIRLSLTFDNNVGQVRNSSSFLWAIENVSEIHEHFLSMDFSREVNSEYVLCRCSKFAAMDGTKVRLFVCVRPDVMNQTGSGGTNLGAIWASVFHFMIQSHVFAEVLRC